MSKKYLYAFEIAGWIGMCLCLLAYGMGVYGMWEITATIYLVTNLIGGAFIGSSCLVKRAWPALGLNVVWSFIALSTLIGKMF